MLFIPSASYSLLPSLQSGKCCLSDIFRVHLHNQLKQCLNILFQDLQVNALNLSSKKLIGYKPVEVFRYLCKSCY